MIHKRKIDKVDFFKIKKTFTLQSSIKRIKNKLQNERKILVNHISNKRLVSRIYKELSKPNSTEEKGDWENELENGQKTEQTSHQKDIEIEISSWKDV